MKKFKFLDAIYYAIAARSASQADARRMAKAQVLVQARAARAFVIIQKIRAFRKDARLEQTRRDCAAVPSVVRWSVKGNPVCMQERRKNVFQSFCNAFFVKYPSFYKINRKFSAIDFPVISVEKENGGRYSSRRTYNKAIYKFNIMLPVKYIYSKPNILEFNENVYWYISKKVVKNCLAYKCLVMNKTSFLPEYKYIVNRNGIFYTGKTLKEAVKRAFSSATLTLNSRISRSKYAYITGACKAGIEKFCVSHGLEEVKTVTVRELLSIMDGTEFGYGKFKNAIVEG